jgi:type 2 lantibiotic biosynthesis protein LanM
MLVDLEALCHAHPVMRDEEGAHIRAMQAMGHSVVRVGLLPQRVWAAKGLDGVDLSGVGGEAGQRLPMKVPRWEAAGTDEMRLSEQDATLPPAHNRPTLNGEPVDVLSQASAVERGFVYTYKLLRRHRDTLLQPDSALRACADDEVRAIVRPTRIYTWLLQECTHPDVLRDALDRDRLLDWLWLEVEHRPRLARIVAAERDDLRAGDVPFFTTTPRSRSIWTSAGVEIPDFYERSGLECVEQRLRDLSPDDLERQRWFLRASLTSLSPAEKGLIEIPLTGPPATPAPRAEFLKAARDVGDRLEQLAFTTDTEASWIGLTLLTEEHWALAPLGVDLYGGLPGVALFLARLANVTSDARYERLAKNATATFTRLLDSATAWPLIGAFAGWGGAIYVLTHLGLLLRDQALIERAESLLPRVRALIPSDTHFDLISGSAGAIMGMTALHAVTGTQEAIIVIREAGNHLVEHAQAMPDDGVAWPSQLPAIAQLVGCSHGVAGIALSLLTASALSAEERFERVARAAMAYERSTYSELHDNWPDRRTSMTPESPASSRKPQYMMAWCHGAPGIGLARLAGLRFADDSNVRGDIVRAINTTRRHGFGRNHSLCHGDLGNLELLTCAATRLGDAGLASSAACFAASVLRSIRQHGCQCGVPLQVETPGLMMGLAGIGDGLLRIAEPRLPSILMLQPP